MSTAGDEFTRLIDIMGRLRAPDGCPWDREQTIDTLKKYVLEETYEVVDAIDRHDHDGLREELGDFMLQAVFLAQLEQEEGRFGIEDSVRAIADKLVRRHPHVFKRDEGEAALDTANQVRTRWEEIKTQERGGSAKPKTLLSGIPAALPSLVKSSKPCRPSSARKLTCPSTTARPLGAEPFRPGRTSFTSFVPAAVPSLRQSSAPCTPSSVLK